MNVGDYTKTETEMEMMREGEGAGKMERSRRHLSSRLLRELRGGGGGRFFLKGVRKIGQLGDNQTI